MKASIANISLCVIIALAHVLGGCRKKADETSAGDHPVDSTKTSISELGGKAVEEAKETVAKTDETAVEIKEEAVETAVEVKDKVVEKVFSIAQQFNADEGKSIPDITAGAKEMAVENLRKMAEKYRDVIAKNQQQLKEMTQAYVDLPAAERITGEGQILKTGIDEIIKGIDTLKERFGVYYNALKEKAGNLTGLDI